MKKVKIIIGKNNSGKSRIADAMVCSINDSEKSLILGSDIRNPFCFSKCNENTKVVIIENLQMPAYLIGLVFATVDGLMVDRQSKKLFVIHPEIIIVCDESITRNLLLDMGSSLSRRIEIIETIS